MAKILDLDGKYYGTVIELDDKFQNEITIWIEGDNKVSQRELDKGWTKDIGLDHTETDYSYQIAKIIEKALTDAGY